MDNDLYMIIDYYNELPEAPMIAIIQIDQRR